MLTDDLRAFSMNPKGYPDGAAGELCADALTQIERLSSNHKTVVDTKRTTEARLRAALAALQQIYAVCNDNASEGCDARLALNFVRQVASDGFEKATAPRCAAED